MVCNAGRKTPHHGKFYTGDRFFGESIITTYWALSGYIVTSKLFVDSSAICRRWLLNIMDQLQSHAQFFFSQLLQLYIKYLRYNILNFFLAQCLVPNSLDVFGLKLNGKYICYIHSVSIENH